jgi:hypothetical protein
MKKENKFLQKWGNFFKAVFSPVPLFSLGIAVVLIIISINYADRKEFSILMNLIGSIFLAITGAFIKGGYDELAGESVLVKKGQSALRNLSSITNQITFIRSWINKFIKKDVSKRDLEEINRHLETALVNISSGLADWIDIVPELKEGGEVAKSLESTIKAYVEEIFEKKRELLKAGENKELKKQLEGKIKELEKEVKELGYQKGGIISGSAVIPSAPISLGSISPVSFSDNPVYFNPNKRKGKGSFNEFIGIGGQEEELS